MSNIPGSSGLASGVALGTTTIKATVGTASDTAVTATGNPIPSLSEVGPLPSGVNFVDHGDGTGTLSGTPAGSGTFAIDFIATNSVSQFDQPFTLTVNPASVPGIYSPTNNSAFNGNTATFQWIAFPSASACWLDVGKEQGGDEYYQSNSLAASVLSQTVNSLPSDGSPVWAHCITCLTADFLPTAAKNGPGCTIVPPQTYCLDPPTIYLTLWTLVGGVWQAAPAVTYTYAPE